MEGRVFTLEEKCTACNKCIAVCPVDAANRVYLTYDGSRKVSVDGKYCIACGACLTVYDHGARDYYDDTDRFFQDLSAGEKITVVAAPAAKLHFPELKNLFGWLKSLGVPKVYDVSLGADIATWACLKAMKNMSLTSMIAQPCPSIVNYCEHYQAKLLPYLAPIQSPLICLAIYLRQREQITGKIAFLSPCIAKADEITDPNTGNLVHYNVTFSKLKRKLSDEGIDLQQYPALDFDGMSSGLGHVYSRPGGLAETIRVTEKDMWIRSVDAVEYAYPYLREYLFRRQDKKPIPAVVDILNCKGGCNFGTGTDRDIAEDDIDFHTDARKRRKEAEQISVTEAGTVYAVEKYFDQVLDWQDFRREYTDRSIENGLFSDEDLDGVYRRLGKRTPEGRNINCYACGYGSCKRFAQATKLGMNIPDSCIDYERNLLMHDSLTNLLNHAGLENTLEHCLHCFNRRDCDHLAVAMMDVDDFKHVNDHFGHDVGDKALKAVGKVIERSIRSSDAAGRWGGDEFMIIMPHTEESDARTIVQRIRNAIAQFDVLPEGEHFTSSAGVAAANPGDSQLMLFQRVDKALYEAKKNKPGR